MATKTKNADRQPALYSVNLIVVLTLIFTPIFGAQLQSLNWQALGQQSRARASQFWVRTTLWMIALFIVAQVIFDEIMVPAAGVYFLFVLWFAWFVTTGRHQLAYVSRHVGKNYTKRPIGRAIMLGAAGWTFYTAVTMTVSLGLALWDTKFKPADTDNGVLISRPAGADAPVVEPIPESRRLNK